MTYVVTDNCIRCKYMDCVEVCPVDCFYEGENFLVIHPDECISCGLCESVCPVAAIYPRDRLPDGLAFFEEVNREFFAMTGIGSPGGANQIGVLTCDHPRVASAPEMGS